jgi:hypothetical protein
MKLKERALLTDPRFLRLAVVDLGELEMLEGLRENRASRSATPLKVGKLGLVGDSR